MNYRHIDKKKDTYFLSVGLISRTYSLIRYYKPPYNDFMLFEEIINEENKSIKSKTVGNNVLPVGLLRVLPVAVFYAPTLIIPNKLGRHSRAACVFVPVMVN